MLCSTRECGAQIIAGVQRGWRGFCDGGKLPLVWPVAKAGEMRKDKIGVVGD